ncbi:MAG TPA: DUF4349 domain-containing protein [Actinomycetaceae bacterium]|nr:DUF4349 domain-containing protein [Actinomycetaceae bacterium]
MTSNGTVAGLGPSLAPARRRAAATNPFVRVISILVLAFLTLTGCTTVHSGVDEGAVVTEEYAPAAEGRVEFPYFGDGAEQSAADAAAGGTTAPTALSPDAVMITRGQASVRSDDPNASSDAFVDVVTELGGRVTESSSETSGDRPRVSVTARVPADRYQDLVDRLEEFGEVVSHSSTSEDVGQQVADLEARRVALEASIGRLTELMTAAETTADLIEAETQLTWRQAELDSLNAQLTWLADQVSMSTLTVTFATHPVEIRPPADNPFERAWEILLDSLKGILYVFVAVLPWIVLIGAAVWLGIALVRRRRARMAQEVSDELPAGKGREEHGGPPIS